MPLVELIPLLISIVHAAPGVVADVKQIWALATNATPPTQDQQAQVDAAFEAAYQALEAS